MRIGNFWGMTAPMFVLAFEDRYEPLPIFNKMLAHSCTGELRGLQQELVYLTNLERFQECKCSVDTLSVTGDDVWENGSLVEMPECSNVFRSEVLQRVLVKCLEREKAGKFKDLSELQETMTRVLDEWAGSVKDVQRAVVSVLRELPAASESNVFKWAAENEIVLETSVSDEVMIGGTLHTLTENEKAVITYFLQRMPDIHFWIEELFVKESQQQKVFGLPFFQLAKRKPESLWYVVLSQFERIKYVRNTKVLTDTIEAVRSDTQKFKELYEQFVLMDLDKAERVSNERTNDFFLSLMGKGFDKFNLTKEDQLLLDVICEKCQQLTESYLSQKFWISVHDWTDFGKSLIPLGICGLNGRQEDLFAESVLNTVMSTHKLFVSEDAQRSTMRILTDDVEAMLDTMLPVGKEIE